MFLFRLYFSFFILFHLSACSWEGFKESFNAFYSWAKEWQKDQIKKRYGVDDTEPEKIPEWQEEIKEYEEVIEKKILAAHKIGNLYQKIGETYAQMNSYGLCVKNLEKAIEYDKISTDIFYTLGLCYGNMASKNNWEYNLSKKAEKNFLKSLHLDNSYYKAKFQLGIIYLYGFGKNNPYRVLNNYIIPKQFDYRNKARKLLLEYQNEQKNDPRSYFALANLYKLKKENGKASDQMRNLISMLKKEHPKNYQNLKEYKSAVNNLNLLQNTK